MLDCDLATLLLTQQNTNNGLGFSAHAVSSDLVRGCEKYERMQRNGGTRVRGLVRDKGVL